MNFTNAFRLGLMILLLAGQPLAAATYTDGTVTFNVTFRDPSGHYSARVDAFWVTDATGKFIQNIRKDAATRQQYLYQWAAARKTTAIDGYTGATISTWTPVTVTWDCRDTNNVVVPDGTYKIYVEFTDLNGQGPWTTNGLAFSKGLTNVSATYPDQTYLKNMGLSYTPIIAYDIAVTSIAPSFAPTNGLVPLTILITNKTSWPESFTAVLSNTTSGLLLGSWAIDGLAGNGSTNLTLEWNTAGLEPGDYVMVAHVSAVSNETMLDDNTLFQTITLRPPIHDVAITAVTAPQSIPPDVRTNIALTIVNLGDAIETFSVELTDDTDLKVIGTQQIAHLDAPTATIITFPWDTTNASWGVHTLRAVAASVPGESDTINNTLTFLSTVTPSLVTNVYIAKSNYWRYHDQGVDLGATWRNPNYDDNAWPLGRGPFGYGDPPLNTTLHYGTSSSAKYPTYYFRTTFALTNLPNSLTMRLRRDDGAVVYLNGMEVHRVNLPHETIRYTSLALEAISGSDETAYFETSLPVTNLVAGTNLVAVEVHQSTASSSDLSFDLELLGAVLPSFPKHDVGVTTLIAPVQALPGVATNILVLVTNQGQFTESFPVVLSDETDHVLIGIQQVTNLAAAGSAATVFKWQPPLAPWTNHLLRAVGGPVASEINLRDNTNLATVFVAPWLETNVLVGCSNVWRFNDTGSDLSLAPWKDLEYYDDDWLEGQAPFGYGEPVTTTISYGPDASHKYPTYYFRKTFYIDVPPNWMRLRLRCDDGAAVYLNGVEIHRVNLAGDPVTYSTWANAAMEGTNELAYFETEVPAVNAILGRNVLAVEVHQWNARDGDLLFDAELLSINPVTPRTHEVTILEVAPGADALVGDLMRVAVTVTNRGNVSGTFCVGVQDIHSNQILASTVVTNLAVGSTMTLSLDWNTIGVSPGTHTLAAFTVLNNLTNLAEGVSAQANLTGTGFGLNATGLASAIGGRCAAVAAFGDYLLVGAGATLEVWERSRPLELARVSQLRLPGLIEGLTCHGNFAFAACGSAGVQFVDLTAPASPVHVATYDTSGHAYNVSVSGDFLFIADGVDGLRIVDITRPGSPVLAGAYYPDGPARAVAIEGTRAYLVDAHKGMLVLEAANPAALSSLGLCAFHAGHALAVTNGLAYVVDANNHFFVMDATVPQSPKLMGSIQLTNQIGQSVALQDQYAYVPALDSGLLVVDVSKPAAPVLMGAVPVSAPGESVGAVLGGNTLYVANGFGGIQVLDATTPGNPIPQSEWPMATRACAVAVNNSIACVAAGETGLRIYGVTNPAAPVWIGWLTNVLNARCVALAGDTALIGDGQYGLKVVNVANPAAPLLLGSWQGTNLAFLRNVGLAGSRALASDGRTVALFDLSQPERPVLVASFVVPAFAFDMSVAGSRAYLACGHAGLIVLDIGSSSLTQMGRYDSPGFATGVSVSGTMAYLADGPGGWSVLDVSGATPVLIKTSTSEGPVSNVALAGVLAAFGNGLNLIQAMDVTMPLTPVPRSSFSLLVRTMSLAVHGNQVFAAEDEAGLAIGTISTDADGDGLPDAWEVQIVNLDPNDSFRTIQDVRPHDDFDGDGLANVVEYIAGTSPTDSGSRFAVYLPPLNNGASPIIQWTSVAGRIYTIHKSTNLQSGFMVLQDDITATPPLNSFVDPAPDAAAFYIISVR